MIDFNYICEWIFKCSTGIIACFLVPPPTVNMCIAQSPEGGCHRYEKETSDAKK